MSYYSYKKPEQHLNTYIHTIISHVRKYDHPVSFASILKTYKINLYENPMILQLLKKNSKIIVECDTLQYKPTYDIKSKDDLLTLLKHVSGETGLEYNELIDGPINVIPFINSLVESGDIFILKDFDGSQILFHNDLKYPRASAEVLTAYHQIKVPEYNDMLEEMKCAGLSTGHISKKRQIHVQQPKQTKKVKRKIKITNTHLKDLDLNE
ncbi:hypothetical protein EDEG_02504 [Edhazardia aedis USNM 41457]|uniref:TFIIE beta domain-containing protein n=1 Tax=Edhazardia aedis (strain USNM 41457) TaxID=1003232 RepID=J8ZTZ3_EDHAE|nr:hypothetical protein EDEG_02504 [Edhazardia aedis USNM 41457]|eukprot:EJW03118.1 hypothetical protein EDEG_02504 [Edhazardia aedis USNM 41457]